MKLLDVEEKLSKALINRRRSLILFIVSSIFVVTLDVVLMATSKDSYIVELILTIIFTIAYLLFFVFYFTVLRKEIVNEMNFYSQVKDSELNLSWIIPVKFEDEMKNYDGFDYYVLNAITKNHLNDVEQNYLVPRKFDFKKDKKILVKTYGTVVVEVGEEKWH